MSGQERANKRMHLTAGTARQSESQGAPVPATGEAQAIEQLYLIYKGVKDG